MMGMVRLRFNDIQKSNRVCAANEGIGQRDSAENDRYEAFQLENPGFALIYFIAFFLEENNGSNGYKRTFEFSDRGQATPQADDPFLV
ncbi:hypothetical protein [Nitrosospira multiformis]|uniref:hypothetical protein n=1 Tax=Nitrosospira multiformis TaxID=1231 RepID=UPI001C40AA27|nr:hypothetical protein [Nitrosospira multiformis]